MFSQNLGGGARAPLPPVSYAYGVVVGNDRATSQNPMWILVATVPWPIADAGF